MGFGGFLGVVGLSFVGSWVRGHMVEGSGLGTIKRLGLISRFCQSSRS